MFYLKTFYQSIWDLKIRGISFLILSLGILVLAGNRNIISNLLLVKEKAIAPYFNALIDHKVNSSSIVRKMKNLPGVINVTVKSSTDVKNDVKNMVRDLDESVMENLLQIRYQGIKVELDRGLESRGQKLIQEYLNRLVGKESVTMTGVRTPKIVTTEEKDTVKLFFIKWVDVIVLASFLIVWIFAAWTCGQSLLTRSYIIEKFQRKKSVAVKSFLIGMIPLYLISIAPSLFLDTQINVYYVTIVFIIALGIGLILNSQKLKLITTR